MENYLVQILIGVINKYPKSSLLINPILNSGLTKIPVRYGFF